MKILLEAQFKNQSGVRIGSERYFIAAANQDSAIHRIRQVAMGSAFASRCSAVEVRVLPLLKVQPQSAVRTKTTPSQSRFK
jgi:hypothetical protein